MYELDFDTSHLLLLNVGERLKLQSVSWRSVTVLPGRFGGKRERGREAGADCFLSMFEVESTLEAFRAGKPCSLVKP